VWKKRRGGGGDTETRRLDSSDLEKKNAKNFPRKTPVTNEEQETITGRAQEGGSKPVWGSSRGVVGRGRG